MKRLFFVLAVVAAIMTSCSNNRVDVKADNGAIMTVRNRWDLPVMKGQKICIKSVGITPNWYIPNEGEMKDTSYLVYSHDSTRSTFVDYKIVTVISE